MNLKTITKILTFTAVALFFSQCNDKEATDPIKKSNTTFSSSEAFLESKAPKMQTFQREASSEILIKSINGLHYRFRPNSFRTLAGSLVSGSINVEITEYISKADMVFSGVTTTAGNSLLESGGMFKIDVKQNGEELALNTNTFRVMVPTEGQDPEMQIFSGSDNPDDSTSLINWTASTRSSIGQDSTIGQDTIFGDTTNYDSIYNDYYYYSLNISFLSWCNLDRYRNAPTGTQVRLKITDTISSPYAVKVYMVFQGRSVVPLYYDNINTEWNSGSFNLPDGWDIKLIAVYVDQANKQLKYKLVNSTIAPGHLETVGTLDIISEADIEAIIRSL
jgi:hypothetical protein